MPEAIIDKAIQQKALERILAAVKNVKEESMATKPKTKTVKPKTSTAKSAPRKKRTTVSKDKKIHGDPDNHKVQTREDVKKKKEETFDNSFIPVEIFYYLKWKCPSCKKTNLQEFASIYNVYGPAWSASGVTCAKCRKHYNIIEQCDDEMD